MGFNNLSKNKVLFFVVISAFLILTNAGCTRKAGGTSTLKLSFPAGLGSSKITNFTYSKAAASQSISIQSDDGGGPTWNASINPATFADVNCIMIAVAGPEFGGSYCTTSIGPSIVIGKWAGGIPIGGTFSIEVPSGPQREITIIGLKTQNGACKDFKTNDMLDNDLSEPHVIGKIVRDLPGGTVSLNIPVASTSYATLPKLGDCQGPAFNFQSAPLFFGDATSGLDTITGVNTYTSLGGVSRKVQTFDPTLSTTTAIGVSDETGYSAGDEVMITIEGIQGAWTGTGDFGVSPCGFRGWQGRNTFARILATSTGTLQINKGTFIDKLHYTTSGVAGSAGDISNININLGAPADSLGTFCHMKIAKVLHFFDMNMQPGSSILADQFSFSGDGAGILPIRINGTLTMQNGSFISTAGLGYASSTGTHGEGLGGYGSACSGPTTTNTGGSCSLTPSDGGGGGGHGNLNAANPFGPSGGTGGGGGMSGGYGAGENCGDGSCFGNLVGKMFMGGAGGSSSTIPGGYGGGMIFVTARNIVIAAGESAYIKAYGLQGANSASISTGTGGGGAGGSILLSYKNLNLNTTGSLNLDARGGNSGNATGTTSNSGGGGGAGRIHIIACNSSQYPYSAIATYLAGGIQGTVASGTAGLPGLEGSLAQYNPDCSSL